MRKHLLALGAVAAIAVSGLPLLGGAASASSERTLTASCHKGSDGNGGFDGRVRVYYSPANGYDKITKITYDLDGLYVGSRSNVRLRIRWDIPNNPDETLWSWTSGDNISTTPGSRYPGYSVKYATKWHVDATFTFDKDGIDPVCTATTESV